MSTLDIFLSILRLRNSLISWMIVWETEVLKGPPKLIVSPSFSIISSTRTINKSFQRYQSHFYTKMASNFDPTPPYPYLPLISPTPSRPNTQPNLPQTPTANAGGGGAKLVITGGNKLSGHVSISGSKNSALSILAATLCCSGSSKLNNVPNLSDTRTMASILSSLGAQVEFSDNEVVVNTDHVGSVEPDAALIARIRGGFFVLGPLLARFGRAVVALPGGCDIGARPVDIYVRGLRQLGAVVELRLVGGGLSFYFIALEL